MSELIESLASIADLVIFDSPPVLAVTDAAVLSRQLDGVVLVVDTGETREPLARRAVEELTKVGSRVLGVTLNRLSPTNSGGYYYYYYHHYYTEGDGKDSSGGPGDGGTPPSERVRRETPGTLRSAARRLGALFPMSRSE
jgi:Mrp family chromosome partitioning ATPase